MPKMLEKRKNLDKISWKTLKTAQNVEKNVNIFLQKSCRKLRSILMKIIRVIFQQKIPIPHNWIFSSLHDTVCHRST